MIETTEQRGLPIWLSLVVIVFSLGAGSGLLYWLLADARPTGEVVLAPPGDYGRPMRRNMAPPPPADDVIVNGKDSWTVNSGRGQMRITMRDDKPVYRFAYQQSNYATPEQYQLNMLARQVVYDEQLQKKIAATPDQIEKLRPYTSAIGIRLSDADKKTLIDLWSTYSSASGNAKNDAKQKLLTGLKDISEKSLPATRTAVEERAKVVKTILSADQIKKAQGQ
jgi:hypothetical protein